LLTSYAGKEDDADLASGFGAADFHFEDDDDEYETTRVATDEFYDPAAFPMPLELVTPSSSSSSSSSLWQPQLP
jgi:hypothetical protein